MADIVSIITYDHSNLYKKLTYFIYPIMSWSVLFTLSFVYVYIYHKWKILRRNTPGKKQFSSTKSRFLIPFLVVLTFILLEECGSVISIITNSIELKRNVDKFTQCVSLMLFATVEISDTFIYIFVQKNIRKNCLLIENYLKINCFERRQKLPSTWTAITFRKKYDLGAKLMRLNYNEMFPRKKISVVTAIKRFGSTYVEKDSCKF